MVNTAALKRCSSLNGYLTHILVFLVIFHAIQCVESDVGESNLFEMLGNQVSKHQHGPDMDKLLKGQIKLNVKTGVPKNRNWNNFSMEGFWSSFLMIMVSEIGDKTFFIAAILAMKNSRFIVWFGAAGALFVMTIIAVVAGSILQVVPVEFTHYGAALLFLLFALKLLWEAKGMKGGEASDELREAEEELLEADKKAKEKAAAHSHSTSSHATKRKHKNTNANDDIELGNNSNLGGNTDGKNKGNLNNNNNKNSNNSNSNSDSLSNDIENEDCTHLKGKKLRDRSWNLSLLFRSFGLTFISEIGDRSQITTIVLASHKSPYGVMVGAAIGHAICTAIAVLGGKVLASRISERNVTLIGGILFLAFSIESFIYGPLG